MESFKESAPLLTKAIPHLVDSIFVRGEGTYVWDHNDRRYLDFTSGIGVTNTGHCHPKVVAAIHEQADLLLHTHQNMAFHRPALQLLEVLHDVTPPELDTYYFANSGAEVVEGAVKLARQATGRTNIIAFQYSFHGRTVMTMSLTASKTIYRAGFQPLMPGVFFAPYAYCYRCPMAEADPEKYGFDKDCTWPLDQVEFLLKSQTSPEETAAILVEPVIGEGGYIVPPPRFLQGLRKICDKHEILLIIDEIQSGFGRTGRFFAFEHFGIIPDILLMAKSIASGMPLSAIASRREIMDASSPGSHGGTYGGNAVACAAGVASIKVLKEEKLIENAARIGTKLLNRLQELKEKNPCIGDVRGLGLMVGVEFVQPGTRIPHTDKVKAVQKACMDDGLLILTCGTYENVIRWMPPLVINEDHLDEALNIFEGALKKTEDI